MGLDLVVEGCAKPGHEQEWRDLLRRSFAEESLSEAETARFQEISTPPYERVGAPRVGTDAIADQWLLKTRNANTPQLAASVLKEFAGYYVLELVECDGVPRYSNADSYEGADRTSFRGAFFDDCSNVLTLELFNDAWNHKFPEEGIGYGEALLAAADSAESSGGIQANRKGSFLERFGLRKAAEPVPLSEQLDIVRAAGRWFIFWGKRGHAIRAWF